MPLTARQEQFCAEYIIDLNGVQAALRAGYSQNYAVAQSSRLLDNVGVAARVAELKAQRQEKTLITAEDVINGLKEVAQRCMQKVPVMEFDYESKSLRQKTDANGQGIWAFDSQGANRALELLGKHVGVFERDNRQKSQIINVAVIDNNNG